MWKVRTFESHHEVVESILILLISFSVVLADILVYCLLDNLDCALMVSSWTEECGVNSGEMWSVGSLLTSRKLPFDIRRECGFELEGIGTKSSCFGNLAPAIAINNEKVESPGRECTSPYIFYKYVSTRCEERDCVRPDLKKQIRRSKN